MQQVYTLAGLSGLKETMGISVTRVTFADSEWENDKWPIFAHVRYYDSVKRDRYLSNTSGGKLAEDVYLLFPSYNKTK